MKGSLMRISITVNNALLEYAGCREGTRFEVATYTDAICALHHGYEPANEPEDRFVWRLMNLVPLCHQVQAELVFGREDEVNAMDDEAVNVLMNESKTNALWEGREWVESVPLIVIADAYEEADDIPTGNVRVVSYSDERSFVYSLALLGIISVEESEDEEADVA